MEEIRDNWVRVHIEPSNGMSWVEVRRIINSPEMQYEKHNEKPARCQISTRDGHTYIIIVEFQSPEQSSFDMYRVIPEKFEK